MKIKVLIVFFLLAVSIGLAAKFQLDVFRANSDGKVIKIEWQKNDETSIKHYQLERSGDSGPFKTIQEFNPQGSNHLYQYVDENPYLKPSDTPDKSGNSISGEYEYIYRLKVFFENNSYKYSDEVNVTHKTSSIRRTWGMIKEMFK